MQSGGKPEWDSVRQMATSWQERWPPLLQPEPVKWQAVVHARLLLVESLTAACSSNHCPEAPNVPQVSALYADHEALQ